VKLIKRGYRRASCYTCGYSESKRTLSKEYPVKRTPSNSRLVPISAFLVANLLTPAVFRQAVAQGASVITRPPVARVRPVVDDYFGTKVTDPYRYMEHLNNPEVAKWMEAQNDYTRRVLGRISGRDELLARIEQLDKSIPARVGGIVRFAGIVRDIVRFQRYCDGHGMPKP
jgi:hypothetical protein